MSGLNRVGLEKFYTKPEVAKKCIDLLQLTKNSKLLEPSAGSGAFSDILLHYGYDIISFDIEPEKDYIIKQDFLSLDTSNYKDYIVIGNPPFGRQSCLAKKFIKKCAEFASVIAFILPKSFKKNSMNKCFPHDFHLSSTYDLDPKSFTVLGTDVSVPCVFQVWDRRNWSREPVVKYVENNNYIFKPSAVDATFAFRRVGSNAGKFIFENLCDLSKQSHYFIKSNYFNQMTLENIEFESDNTTGPRSISKQELIKELNLIFVRG